MRLTQTAFAVAAMAAFYSPSALATGFCFEQKTLRDALSTRYGEHTAGMGLSKQGHLLQVFVNPETGSWTAVRVTPSGTACVLDAGEHWQDRPAAAAP